MESTRRETLGLVGVAAAAGMLPAGVALSQPNLGSSSRMLNWVPAVTPCDKNGRFDPTVMRDMLAWYKEQGADGIVIMGSAGEFPSFTVVERKQVSEVALKNNIGLNIIVGTGTSNIADTVELSQHAQAHGADGLLVVPPFYFKGQSDEGLAHYYSTLFDQVSIPINFYHVARLSGAPITIELMKKLRHYPNIAGMKFSADSAEEYAEFVKVFPELNMRAGWTAHLESALDAGMGAVLGEVNFFGDIVCDVFRAFRAKQDDWRAKSRKAKAATLSVFEVAGVDFVAAMKYSLSKQMGIHELLPRAPLLPLSDTKKTLFNTALERARELPLA